MASKYRVLRPSEDNSTQVLSAGASAEPIEIESLSTRSICVDVSFQHTILDQGRLHCVLRKLSDKRLKNQQVNLKISRENVGFGLDKSDADTRVFHVHDGGSQENLVASTKKHSCKENRRS